MKANLENLYKAIKARFESSKMFCNDEEIESAEGVNLYYDDVQIGVFDCSVPTIADVRSIASAFFNNANRVVNLEESWNLIDLFVSDGEFKDEVDLETLKMGLSEDAYKKILN